MATLDSGTRVPLKGEPGGITVTPSSTRGKSSGTRKRRPKGSGAVRQLPSGRWQARVPGAKGTGWEGKLYAAPETFDTKLDAQAWLSRQIEDQATGIWAPPDAASDRPRRLTLRTYSARWLAERDVRPRTRVDYQSLLDTYILPELGDSLIDRISPTTIRSWHAQVAEGKPTTKAHAYGLLRTILGTAKTDGLIADNPCRVPKGGQVKRQHQIKPATPEELAAIVAAIPDRYKAMVSLAAWCALRFGELTEMRRKDVDLDDGVVRITRAVTRVKGQYVVGDPKTEAGVRTVTIPPHLLPQVERHLADHVGADPDALLFPAARHGGHMAPSALTKVFYPARDKAGRSDLRFHDLRHTGAVYAALAGATLADLMQRLGHTTPAMAMHYQHAAQGRDAIIAASMSAMVAPTPDEDTVTMDE